MPSKGACWSPSKRKASYGETLLNDASVNDDVVGRWTYVHPSRLDIGKAINNHLVCANALMQHVDGSRRTPESKITRITNALQESSSSLFAFRCLVTVTGIGNACNSEAGSAKHQLNLIGAMQIAENSLYNQHIKVLLSLYSSYGAPTNRSRPATLMIRTKSFLQILPERGDSSPCFLVYPPANN